MAASRALTTTAHHAPVEESSSKYNLRKSIGTDWTIN
jgi:hypothetical protein